MTGSDIYQNCSAGKYNAGTGKSASSDCLACPAGFACGVGTFAPTACTEGTFSDLGQAECLPINVTVVFAGFGTGAPFLVRGNAIALAIGGASTCTSLNVLNASYSSYYQAANGLCTDRWVFGSTRAGPHYVWETCELNSNSSIYTYIVTSKNNLWTWNETDTASAGSVYVWSIGCTLTPARSFVGYWRSDGGSCYNISSANQSGSNATLWIPAAAVGLTGGALSNMGCLMTLLFDLNANNYMLNCTNGRAYLGVIMFNALGVISPSAQGNGGPDSTFLVQQNLLDLGGTSVSPTTIIPAVQALLLMPTYQPALWPASNGIVVAQNLFFGCPCPTGQAGPAVPQCTACLPGTFASSVNSSSCRNSPVGSYVPLPGAATATLCPLGAVCPIAGMPVTMACDAGAYCPATGMHLCRHLRLAFVQMTVILSVFFFVCVLLL